MEEKIGVNKIEKKLINVSFEILVSTLNHTNTHTGLSHKHLHTASFPRASVLLGVLVTRCYQT